MYFLLSSVEAGFVSLATERILTLTNVTEQLLMSYSEEVVIYRGLKMTEKETWKSRKYTTV